MIDSAGISTVTVVLHRGSVPPAGQLLPAAAVEEVAVITLFPVSGFFTVTVPVTVTLPPAAMFPVHDTPVAVTVSVPDVAVWSPLGVASSRMSVTFEAMVIPV